MIEFEKYELKNGLRLLIHPDKSTPLAAFNLLYDVGSKDEEEDKTGMAHLFEHLMFGGSQHAANFDDAIQLAGGENNAYTNIDTTNYYELLPAQNIETAFWLESDRMQFLNLNQETLQVQQKVVIEEFKETCLNQPYGDAWHHISEMAYHIHNYRWPVIGKVPQHVESATLKDLQQFYNRYYCPNNAVLSISGNVDPKEMIKLAEKWFSDIPPGEQIPRALKPEPPQEKPLERIRTGTVPHDALYLAFHNGGRLEPDFYAEDLLSDVLCNGASSKLYRKMIKEKQVCSFVDCYITGSIDPGLLVIEARPAQDVPLETVHKEIWTVLETIKKERLTEVELQKWKNKMESHLVFSELNILNKAMHLSYLELLNHPEWVNQERAFYQNVSVGDIYRVSNKIFCSANCNTLYYRAKDQ